MRKVKNNKWIRHLAAKSFQASKTRNRIAVLAIALTSMLFTSLFTIGMGAMESFQRETMRQVGGDSHGVIKNITREQYEKLKCDPLIVESADCIILADKIKNPEFLKRHVEAWYIPEYHYAHWFIDIIEGRAPKEPDEILMDEVSLELLGLEPKAGQKVTLQMLIKSSVGEVVDRTFTVTGVIKADSALNVGFAYMAKSYLTAYQEELQYTYDKDFSDTGAIKMDVNFANSMFIQEKLNQVITNAGYSCVNTEPEYIESNANWAYVSDGASTDPLTMGAIICGLFLIILTGYLIIYNIFQISVIRDIRFYGLIKTIGTTGKQIKRMIHFQAIRLCLFGIPLGLLTGFFIGKEIVPAVMAISSFEGNDVVVSVNPWILIGATLFSLLTVWISTGKPARIAAKVSPVEAVRFSENNGKGRKKKKSTDGGKLWKMSLSNLGRSKSKTVFVILSLSLAVILLNSVYTISHSFDMDTYLKKFVSSDFLVGNAVYFGQDYYLGAEEGIEEERLSDSFLEYCEQLDGVEEGGRLYGNMVDIGLRKDSWEIPSYTPVDENGNAGFYFGGGFIPFNQTIDGDYVTETYGMEEFFYKELEIYKGETDLEIIKEKLETGKYVLAAVTTDDNNYVEEDSVLLQPGDKVVLTYGEGKTREFEVLSLIKANYYGLSNRMRGFFSLYTSADTFQEMASAQCLMTYAFNAEDDKEASIAAALENYTTTEEPLMHYESKQYWVDSFSDMTDLFTLIGGVLTLVITMIGILNFINSILTGIVTRQQEFAMLQAIGMTRKQLNRMLTLEGIYYALATIGASLLLGSLVSVTALKALSQGLWFMKYHFTIVPMLFVYPALLLLGIVVPKGVLLLEKKKSVVERLRKE